MSWGSKTVADKTPEWLSCWMHMCCSQRCLCHCSSHICSAASANYLKVKPMKIEASTIKMVSALTEEIVTGVLS